MCNSQSRKTIKPSPLRCGERCEYIYADGVRLAVRINDVSSLSNFYWFHLDHLGGTHQVTRGDTGEVAVFVPESVDLEGH
ncbi:MAG: hypothetical protein AAGU15_05550 [Anaerolineaceae bacterium]